MELRKAISLNNILMKRNDTLIFSQKYPYSLSFKNLDQPRVEEWNINSLS